MMATLCLSLLLKLSSLVATSSAFAPSTGSFTIVGGAGGVQYLPTSYASSFSFWTLEDQQVVKTQGQASCDAQAPQETQSRIRPTLDILIKGGIPSYIMAGLQTNTGPANSRQPNRLAQQWTTFNSLSVEPNVRLNVYRGASDGADERILRISTEKITETIEMLGMMLSDTDSDTMSTGFHVLSFPLDEWTTIDKTDPSAIITCVLTAEPDARELFTLEPSLIEMTATSFLRLESGL
jgi:hypothetical protein